MKPEIRKVLVCCTSHVSRNVMMMLDEDATRKIPYVIHSDVDYGWLIRYWPPKRFSDDRRKSWRTMPRCLKDVIERAESLGCNLVMFDCDAATLDGIRTNLS